MPNEPFVFRLYETDIDYNLNTPFKKIKKDITDSNRFIVENYRYIAIISEHEVILFPKVECNRIQVKRYSDGDVKTSTISNDWDGPLNLHRIMEESIFDKYLKESFIIEGKINAQKKNVEKL